MTKTGARLFFAFVAASGGRAYGAYTYQAFCSAGVSSSPVSNATIISAFGEPRPTTGGTSTNPVRFHGGVDIQQCELNTLKNVFSILGGTRTVPTACINNQCVRIRDSQNHAFDYEHITISPTLPGTGTYIAAGTQLGTIDNSQDSLHLQESIGVAGSAYRFNPQRLNALDFDHSGSPTFTQTSITGANNQSIILLPESSSYPEGLQANPTAFQFRNGAYYVRGKADVLVSASGGTGSTDTRKGVFAAGFNIPIPPAKKNYSYNVSFMQIAEPGGALSPTTSDYWTIYLSSNPSGVTYFASNLKYNGSPDGETQDTFLDTPALPVRAGRSVEEGMLL